MLYDWPGNVRELENVIERSVILSSKAVLGVEDVQLAHAILVEEGECFQTLKTKLIAQFERTYILDLLRNHQGNITRAAAVAGKDRRAFWELMRKHDIRAAPHRGVDAQRNAGAAQ
jgi:DNA-binding NtrC family response regulator